MNLGETYKIKLGSFSCSYKVTVNTVHGYAQLTKIPLDKNKADGKRFPAVISIEKQ